MNCLHVKVDGKMFAVMRREYTTEGIIYHLCDSIGKYLKSVHEKQIVLR
jgi:hypothetical protein